MSPFAYIFQYSLTDIFWLEWSMRDWRGISGGQKGSRNHDMVHVSCFLSPGSPDWCEGMAGPAMASCSLCPSSASSSSGPDMCMFSSVTVSRPLQDTRDIKVKVTGTHMGFSSSSWGVQGSCPHAFHIHPFPAAPLVDFMVQHQAQRQLPSRNSLTSTHNCVMSDP